MDPRSELYEQYKIVFAEYRAEVTLGWERQKLFITLNPSLTSIIAVFSKNVVATRVALSVAAMVAVCGAFVVWRAHERYRATYRSLAHVENLLNIERIQTTGGQRLARGYLRLERFKVASVIIGLLLLIAMLDVFLAVWIK
jgi:hypothetical protein